MKIGILTHYNVSSHGAYLQMYAMKKKLESMGHKVVILTYNKNFDFVDEELKQKFSVSPRSIPYYLKHYLIKQGIGITWYQTKKQLTLGKFGKKTFNYEDYSCVQGLDMAIVGSDEVFSLQYGANAMMYGHGVAAKSIISYAPSFGQTDMKRIKEFNCVELISDGLRKFKAISIRDKGSQEIVKELLESEPQIVCDPALLYDFKEELQQLNVKGKQKFIGIYAYNVNLNESDRVNVIQKYAKKHDLKLYSIGAYHKWCDKNIDCNPVEMLWYFKNAECIVTDTFHGTISAIIGQTPVCVFVRDNTVKLDYLLVMLGIQNRKVNYIDDLEEMLETPMNYSDINSRVAKLRDESEQFLVSAIKH